ncbi:MAG: hypothetical protein P5680_19945 [Limnospira sp. PMC 737.11]|uniref:hypothetical protein n=1 Tax=Limnospira sp. PMC 737.11 TaxID=2981095 RepID=UPI0028E1802A|nr:hypothetical protein [Limnospira sp. PMC 737.11]MDT9276850.1 hypothetical protein [Limnospira sp. PMC 737.11]
MPAKSILDDVVQNLDTSDEVFRIKKIMICATHGKWESDSAVIENTPMRDLVQSLYWSTQSLERLNSILNKILSKINKKTEYTVIVNLVLSQVGRLYLEGDQESSTEMVMTSYQSSDRPHSQLDWSVNPENFNHNPPPKKLDNIFDIRFKIMQTANPLRVKILIFSVLENEFTFSDRDWLQLKSIELDNLIEQLFQMFPNFEDLKVYLKKMVAYLEDSDEDAQVATILIEAMRLCYGKPSFNYSSFQELPDSHYSQDQQLSEIAKTQGIDLNESQTIQVSTPANVTQSNIPEISGLQTVPIPTDSGQPLSNSQLVPESSGNRSKSNIIQERLGLKDDIHKRVSQGVTEAITSIANTLQTLEDQLDGRMISYDIEQQLKFKYEVLKDFIAQVQEQILQLEEIVDQSETTERQQTAAKSEITDPLPTPTQISDSGGTNQVLELAKQGNPKAIASFLNHLVKSKGIHVLAQSKNQCLHLILESQHSFAPESTTQFIHKKLLSLQLQSINIVKIYLRKPGDQSFIWAQKINYVNHS